jgi:hypothetical protein
MPHVPRASLLILAGILLALKAKGVQPKELQTSGLEVGSRNPDGTFAVDVVFALK